MNMKNYLRALSRRKDALERYPVLGCEGSLANMRSKKRGPKFFKIGRQRLFTAGRHRNLPFSAPVETTDSARSLLLPIDCRI